MRARVPSLICCFIALCAGAAEIHVPERITSGTALAIQTSGTGNGTVYLVGPGSALKQKVQLGSEITIDASKLQSSGRYTAVLKTSGGSLTAEFVVVPAAPASIAFLGQPSRVPAARRQVVSGTAFVMDKNNNLITSPQEVKFELAVPGAAPEFLTATSKYGIAWVRMDSSKRAGPAQFIASLNSVSTTRVVQQVASEPCNLRIHAQPGKDSIVVQTDPVRDCSGNAVPDGTIVTFTQVDDSGRSTVDARVKRGIARAELPMAPRASISVASGVVAGNEIRWSGGR